MESSDENITVVNEDKKLKKELSFVQLLFLSIGGIIGSGWLFGVNDAAATAGPIVFISWIIGGIIVLIIALTYAELSAMIPRSGGVVRYPHYTHGSYTGYILGWAYLLSAITVPSIEAVGAVTYLSSLHGLSFLSYGETTIFGPTTLLTDPGILIAVLLMIGFFFLNYFGIKFLGRWNEYFVYWKLIIPTLTFIFLFFLFRGTNFTSVGGGFNPVGLPFVFTAIPSAGIVFSYLGFRQALEFGGEAKNPQKDIPRALILSIIIAVFVYTILQVAYIGSIRQSVSGLVPFSWTALSSNLSNYSASPIYTVFTHTSIAFFGAWATILLIDAVISPSGTGWIYLGTSTRVIYGLSTDGYYPKKFMEVNKKNGIPFIPLILSLVIGSIFIAPFPSWYELVGFISSATVFTYIMGGVGLRIFRKKVTDIERPFRLSYSRYIAPAAFVGASLIVYWSGYITLTILLLLIFAGIPVYMLIYGPEKLKIKRSNLVTISVIYWIIIALAFYISYYYIITPAITNISLGIPAPGSIFTYFGIFYVMVAASSLIVTALLLSWASDETKKEIKSGVWLVFYMLFMLLMSYLGAFGPYVSPLYGSTVSFPYSPLLAFPYDSILVIIVTLGFFYYAIRSGYDEDDIHSILAEEGVPLRSFETQES
ncbi:APC family permease [Caldiplasma sukawensis]